MPSLGPVYERNETGAVFYGLALSSPVPLLNTGRPLVGQREAEYHRDCVAYEQARQQVAAQVLAMLVKWEQAQDAAAADPRPFRADPRADRRMQRLYDAGQSDLIKLLQVQRRFIEARNVELDIIWLTTQAYADVLSATGGTPLLSGLPRAILPSPLARFGFRHSDFGFFCVGVKVSVFSPVLGRSPSNSTLL